MPRSDIQAMFAGAGATKLDEKNPVLESELRKRGYPVHGEAQKAVTIASVQPVIKSAAQPALSLSAVEYGQLTAQDRADAGLRKIAMLRSEFETLSAMDRRNISLSGVQIVDSLETPATVTPAPAGQQIITRAQFEIKNAEDRMAHIKAHGHGSVID